MSTARLSTARLSTTRLSTTAGLLGAAAVGLGSLAAAFVYRGTSGQAYSPLNHFVSELGMPSQSVGHLAFNAGIFVGGVAFVVFMLGLARSRRGVLGYLAGAVGAVAGICGALVGVYTADDLGNHAIVALGFFWLGGLAVALASASFATRRDPRFPRWLAIPGLLAVASFAGFLTLLSTRIPGEYATPADRPAVWLLTALEWAVIAFLMGWVALAALTWRRAETVR